MKGKRTFAAANDVNGQTADCLSLTSCALPLLAAIVYLLGQWESYRMVARGDGFAMAFYWSPLVVLTAQTLLVFGCLVGIVAASLQRRLRPIPFVGVFINAALLMWIVVG